MADTKHVFQISGIKTVDKKSQVVHGIQLLGGKYIGGDVYNERVTHLIVTRAMASEKFLAACAQGKWVVTPGYVLESVKKGLWLPEAPYELHMAPQTPGLPNPVCVWRERVSSGALTGAFGDWGVLLLIGEPSLRDMYKRILTAGKARVYSFPPPSQAAITHVLAKHVTERGKSFNAPCYSMCHIARHLFGMLCSVVGVPWTEEGATEEQENPGSVSSELDSMGAVSSELDSIGAVSSELEAELRDYILKAEMRKRLDFPQSLCNPAPGRRSQTLANHFVNVNTLIECGMFAQAVEEIQGSLFPGRLPPLEYLTALMHHALQGKATCSFLYTFRNLLDRLLRNNPPWSSATTSKYFSKLLQCPQCKGGLWSMLDTSVRYCMSIEGSCHSLPSPASPEQLRFHGNLQGFVLHLFQGELHSANSGGPKGLRASVLYGSFWNVWESLTLGSRTVCQLAQLLVQATVWELAVSLEEIVERNRRTKVALGLQDMLSVLVEYWCQIHGRLNRILMEKGLQDLAEHIAALCQDVSPEALTAVVGRLSSPRLKLVVADAVFRNLCFRSGLVMGAEPLSLRKILSSYLPALGTLCEARPGGSRASRADDRAPRPAAEPTSHSRQGSGEGMPRQGKENRGLIRVNTAGETLLHKVCKGNEVATLLELLALPGTDINAKDHAGWTPLHDACNHGSVECVEVLLHHSPGLHLDGQVDGISPVHDALIHGHVDIAKMLLEHGGSALLHQRFWDGRTATDLVYTPSLREELISSARAGDRALWGGRQEVGDPAVLEACAGLLSCLLVCYPSETGVPIQYHHHAQDGTPSLGSRLARALETHSLRRLTAGWEDPRLVRVAEDVEAALGAEADVARLCPAVRRSQGGHTLFLMGLLEGLKY